MRLRPRRQEHFTAGLTEAPP